MNEGPESLRPPEPTEEEAGPVVHRPQPPPPPPFPLPPLFGKYPFEGVEVHDPGLLPYLYLHPIYAPHTEGRLAGRPFLKTHIHIPTIGPFGPVVTGQMSRVPRDDLNQAPSASWCHPRCSHPGVTGRL